MAALQTFEELEAWKACRAFRVFVFTACLQKIATASKWFLSCFRPSVSHASIVPVS